MRLTTPSVSNSDSSYSYREERRMQNSVEELFHEGETYCREGERLESKGEMALSLAFFTNAASKFKQITGMSNLTSESMLRAQIRRESCLKKARTMYRRLLVQSAQSNNQNKSTFKSSTRKTNQVNTEKRPCSTCSKQCFWLKDGLCSDCDLKSSEVHRRNVRRNTTPRYTAGNHGNSRVPRDTGNHGYTAPRDFTRPRSDNQYRYRRAEPEYSESSSEEEYAPVKSCAICHTYRRNYGNAAATRRCC